MYMKYRMHSAGSFGCLIKINNTIRNADQMCVCVCVCVCVVSLIYMCKCPSLTKYPILGRVLWDLQACN